MDGVILFADDQIFSEGSCFEKSLFNELVTKQEHPVVGVSSLDLAEKTIRSLSNIRAFIIDYIFNEKSDIEETPLIERNATVLLDNPDLSIFSLIYIYSNKDIKNEPVGQRLNDIYKDRVRFRLKPSDHTKAFEESVIISKEIDDWINEHKNFSVPFSWNQSINQSVQKIFTELESIDPNWINELYKTAENDGVEPSVEVIKLFQNILSESIIQSEELRNAIMQYTAGGETLSKPSDYARLISFLYYGRTNPNDPIMTGDIFVFENDLYGILVSPECDIDILSKSEKGQLEFLTFGKDDFNKNELEPKLKLKATPLLNKAKEIGINITNANCEILRQTFNQQIEQEKNIGLIKSFTQIYPRLHLLPCFKFEKDNYHGIGLIDFRFGLKLTPYSKLEIKDRIGKLNTPYIQELRQRYLSYKGRVGVPAFSFELRKWLLRDN